MSGFTGLLAPLLLSTISAVAIPVPAGPLPGWPAWVVAAGLLGMGLLGIFGGDDGDESDGAELEDEDFLRGIDAGGSMAEDFEAFDDPLDDSDEDPLAEVEPRLDDLETDLADLASTVSAVRGEQESIRESVEEVEEHVRKLLEVYEVVTQGANPFSDSPPHAAGGGTFGLLEAADGPPAADDAEEAVRGLFEDDSSAERAAVETRSDPSAPWDAGQAAAVTGQSDGAPETDDGLSFEDLKSEFEYVGADGGGAMPPLDEPEPKAHALDETDRSAPSATEPDLAAPEPDRREPTDDGPARRDDGGAKPYLRALPDGFGAELLVMEWLEFLVSSSSVADAIRAVRYYESVGWITEEVTAHLQTVLAGTNAHRDRAATDGGLPNELSVDHHTRSLEYLARINELAGSTGHLRPPAERRTDRRGRREGRGVQR